MRLAQRLLLFSSVTWVIPLSSPANPPEVELKVAGLQVIRELIPPGPGRGFALAPFSRFEKRGVKLAVLLTAPRGEFAAFDFPRSGVERLADDRGNPLRIWPIDPMDAEITENRRYAMFEIASTGLPAGDTKHILAKGTIGVFLGSKTATVRAEPAVIRKGAKLSAGKYGFTVSEIEEKREFVTSWRVTLAIPGKHREIRSLSLLEKTEAGFQGTPDSGRWGNQE